MTGYTIGQLAREFGITTRTLRFYEGHGLLAPQRIGMHGIQRLYSESDRLKLMAIIEAKRLGHSIEGIKTLIALNGDRLLPADAIQQQLARLAAQREEIARAMIHLRTLEASHEVAA